jgi:adenylate kinase
MLSGFNGKVDYVPFITAAEQILVERASGRWTCRAQGHIYHEKFNPPQTPGVCDIDSSELYQRDDDKVETVSNRIKVYFQQTMPLVEYYRRKGVLMEIDGSQPVEQVTENLLASLKR